MVVSTASTRTGWWRASPPGGASPALGEGFSVILMVRSARETCRTVGEAVAALRRIPIAQSRNVVPLDRSGHHATLYLGPDREPAVARAAAGANQQERPSFAGSALRLSAAEAALDEPGMTLTGLMSRFLAPPLHSRRAGSATVYTAVYRPAEGRVDYVRPCRVWPQAIGAYKHDYGELAPS